MENHTETHPHDVTVSTSFPSHHEIVLPLPNNEIVDEDIKDEYKIKPFKAVTQVTEDYPQYAQISIQDSRKGDKNKSPTSIYALSGGDTPKLALKSREVSTRQCKFDIGEEWEQFQIYHNRSVSCPPSPLGGRKQEVRTGSDNLGYAASEPGAEIDYETDGSKEPFPFHFLFSPTSSGVNEFQIVPNPFNQLNHRFHSTLQCPCFLFFFFLCCLPGVHFMQQSDHQFKKGNRKRARKYGNLSTAMYIVGSIVGVAFLAVAIYFAAEYVRQFV